MMALIPIFNGLVRDCNIVIFGLMDGQCRHVMSVVSKDWNVWCNENVKKINSDKQTASAIKDGDMLSIVQNYKYVTENYYNISYRICKSQNMKLINLLIKRGDFHIYNGLYGACKSGNIAIIKYITALSYQPISIINWNICLQYACKSGSRDAIRLITNNSALNWDYGLRGACAGNLVEIANMAIKNGASDWNNGLKHACKHGCIDTMNLMIERGADDWNLGLKWACYDGNMTVIQTMITKGANDWNRGLTNACEYNHMQVIQLMIEKGANLCYHCTKTMVQQPCS